MGGKSQIPGVEEDRLDTEKKRKRRTFVWSGVCSLIFGFVLVNIYSDGWLALHINKMSDHNK